LIHNIAPSYDDQIFRGVVFRKGPVMISKQGEVVGIESMSESLEDNSKHVVPAILFKKVSYMKNLGTRVPFIHVKEPNHVVVTRYSHLFFFFV
jgi:hypothetical protein